MAAKSRRLYRPAYVSDHSMVVVSLGGYCLYGLQMTVEKCVLIVILNQHLQIAIVLDLSYKGAC
jgi:hypothetical protein